jgi:putative transcriptional regulator
MKLGNNIRKFRFENNETSQEELAAAVGVTRQTIHAVEKGKFVPSALLAFKIARHFRVNVEDLFYIIENNNEV